MYRSFAHPPSCLISLLLPFRISGIVLLFLVLLFPVSSRADASPEFHQLLGEINGQLKTFTPTRGPDCTPDLVDKAQNALQGEIFTGALKAVVVKPLETGAKTGLSILGVPAAVITTYSLMRCAMDEADAAAFGRCALGEAIGYGAGAGVDAAGADAISGALSGVALDDAYGRVRGAYESYQSTSEEVSGTSEGDCKVRYSARWEKRARPGARGGKIHFQAWISDCDCTSANEAKSGYISVWFKVHYRRAGNSQPGWTVGTFEELHVEAQCCGQSESAKNRVFLFNPQGGLIPLDADGFRIGQQPGTGTQTEDTQTGGSQDDSSTTEPPPPPPPPPVVLPAPELKEYSRANPCPPCEPIKTKIDAVADEIGDLQQQRDDKLREQNAKREEQRKLDRQIDRLESRLRGEAGVGGESYDPTTGLTTSSYDMGDGRVRIRVTDSEGNVISERFRERESTKDVQDQLAAKERELADINAEIERLGKERDELQARINDASRRWSNLQKALTDCVEKLCREYATCKQFVEHIRSYESAGLQQRSRSILNELYRRAREKGCFDIDETMQERVKFGYDLTGENVYKPSIMDDLQSPDDARATQLLQQQQQEPKTAIQQQQQEEQSLPQDTDEDFDSVADDLQPLGTTPRQPAVTAGEDTTYAPAPVGNGSLYDWSRWRGGRPPNQDEIRRAFERYEALTIAKILLLEEMEAAKKRCDKATWERLRAKYYEIGSSRDDKETLTPITGMDPEYSSSGKYRGEHRVGPVHPELERRGQELRERYKDKIKVFIWSEKDCAKKTKTKISVKVIDVKNISGNNPLDREDPIAEDADEQSELTTGTSGTDSGGTDSGGTDSGGTVQVVNNVPISRLSLAGPDACPEDHYHGNADNCDGVFTPDPAPGVCGHGTVSAVTTIPVSSCPDL